MKQTISVYIWVYHTAPVPFEIHKHLFKVQHFLGRFCRARGLIFLLSDDGSHSVGIMVDESGTLSVIEYNWLQESADIVKIFHLLACSYSLVLDS